MVRDDEEEVELEDVLVKKETEKALLCHIDGKDVWIPKSLIKEGTEIEEEGDEGTLILPQWFADKNDIDY